MLWRIRPLKIFSSSTAALTNHALRVNDSRRMPRGRSQRPTKGSNTRRAMARTDDRTMPPVTNNTNTFASVSTVLAVPSAWKRSVGCTPGGRLMIRCMTTLSLIRARSFATTNTDSFRSTRCHTPNISITESRCRSSDHPASVARDVSSCYSQL